MLTSAFLYYSNSSLKLELEFKTDEINDLNDAKLQKMAAIDAIQIEVGKTNRKTSVKIYLIARKDRGGTKQPQK